jgi:hypothetical protein
MNAYRFKNEEQSRLRIMCSLTLFWFYGSLFVLTAAYIAFLFLLPT